ncbi:MAG: MerR family transcriptional regulator [Myxococcota bacterium]
MPTEPSPAAWTIDDLAREARVPTRTIRFYQARGALMKPEIRGRVAYYGAPHAERLKLIAQLQDRGLRIEAIRDLVARIDRGELDLGQWLGVEQQVQAPWAAGDQAQTLDEAGLLALAGSDRPGLLAELVKARLASRRGEVYLVPSPALLQIAMRFEAAGIALPMAAKAAGLAHKHLGRAVKELVELFVKALREGEVELSQPDTLFATLRPLGTEAVKLMFARQMDRALHELVASDGLGAITAAAEKKRATKRAPRR